MWYLNSLSLAAKVRNLFITLWQRVRGFSVHGRGTWRDSHVTAGELWTNGCIQAWTWNQEVVRGTWIYTRFKIMLRIRELWLDLTYDAELPRYWSSIGLSKLTCDETRLYFRMLPDTWKLWFGIFKWGTQYISSLNNYDNLEGILSAFTPWISDGRYFDRNTEVEIGGVGWENWERHTIIFTSIFSS